MHNPLALDTDLEEMAERSAAYNRQLLYQFQDARFREGRAGLTDRFPSLARLVTGMRAGRLDEVEDEFFRRAAELTGKPFDPQRIAVPWALLTEPGARGYRGLTVADAGAGGYLVGQALAEPRDLLAPWSVTIQGGVQVARDLTGNVTVPRTTGDTVINWQTAETSEADDSTPGTGQASMTPHVGIGVVNLSYQFTKQADPDAWIRRVLTRVAGRATDQAVLNGTGTSGEPAGILGTPGISTVDGGSFAWADALEMEANAAAAGAQECAFIGDVATRQLLKGRERATGNGGFVWQGGAVADRPAFATTDMPDDTLLAGPFGEVVVGFWGPGPVIEVNPYANFKAGGIAVRVVLAVDLAITCDLTAFTAASAIT